MAFPISSQKDDFTYTAGVLPSGSWPAGFGDTACSADGTTSMVDTATGAWRGSYDATTGSLTDCEIWAVLNSLTTDWTTNDEIDFHWRNQILAGGAPSGNWKGYALALKATSSAMSLQVFMYNGTTISNLGSAYTSAQRYSPGCKVGISMIGTTINVYTDENGTGFNQTPVITTSDGTNTYTSGWNGFEIFNSTANAVKIDKYGGGSATSGATFLRPSSDITVGDWVPTPSSPTTLFDKLDETVASDTDYITGTTTVEIKFS